MNNFDIDNKRKTSLRCGTTVNTHWWSLDVPHEPEDVQGPPARMYGRPTSLSSEEALL